MVLTAEDTDMLLGEDYQAVIPQLQERPKQPTPSEQHWLEHKVLDAGELGTGFVLPEEITTPSGCAQWYARHSVLPADSSVTNNPMQCHANCHAVAQHTCVGLQSGRPVHCSSRHAALTCAVSAGKHAGLTR